jgi:hypothetical protein
VIVLVVLTIGVLWYVGYQSEKEKASRLEQYTKEFLDKQKNIEAVAVKGLQDGGVVPTPIETLPPIIISSSTASSTDELRAYGLAVAKALEPLGLKRGNEPQAVMAAIDKNDPSLLRPVVESRIYHQTAVQNLTQVIVPKALVAQHKKILDELNFIVSILREMEKATDQPQPALNNSNSFMSNYLIFLKSIDDLNKYLTVNDSEFRPQAEIKIFVSFGQ